ncbi:MAG: hypothetical protein JNK76_23325 [Planctomycetales bacterium]|nr:hypothetical protein [Planctomycetales bacterium]
MAKKSRTPRNTKSASTSDSKVNKSAAIRDYLAASPEAKPKEIVAALAEKGITVSPNMVSIVKAKTKIKSARRKANSSNGDGGADRSGGLDAVLVLYKAAQGQDVAKPRVRQAFLTLVDLLG